MITEERQQKILAKLKVDGIVKVFDLVAEFNASESTIRRDLAMLEAQSYLKRVHGGAVTLQGKVIEPSYNDKITANNNQKEAIAKYAASLIADGDSIYLDSGTTVFSMIKYMTQKGILVVTNGVSHVEELISCEIPFILLGGKVKLGTKALIGSEAMKFLSRYRFDKCFMGTNGVHSIHGFTTPDPEEAALKGLAIQSTKEAFVLADASKFGEVSFTEFSHLGEACLITNSHDDLSDYQDKTKVLEVKS